MKATIIGIECDGSNKVGLVLRLPPGAEVKPGDIIRKAMKDYFIRVFTDCVDVDPGFNEYDIRTDKGPEMAKLFAFLMDGGGGQEYHDDEGMLALAQSYTDIVSVS